MHQAICLEKWVNGRLFHNSIVMAQVFSELLDLLLGTRTYPSDITQDVSFRYLAVLAVPRLALFI